MAHVEASQLSQTELAELACSYAALILHDDGQDITSTSHPTQATSLTNSLRLLMSRSKATGPSTSQKLSAARTFRHFSTSEVPVLQPPQPLQLLQAHLLQLASPQHQSSQSQHRLLSRKKTWTWATCSDDRNPLNLTIIDISTN